MFNYKIVFTFLLGIMAVMFIAGMFPVFGQAIGMFKSSQSANCPGYVDNIFNGTYSYNSSLESQSIACAALGPYPSLIILAILMWFAVQLIWPQEENPAPQY